MEISWLEVFLAVAEELHFSRAATRCHLSQPAVSKQVQQLEEHLGIVLFERTRRSVRLTNPGGALVAEARRAVDAVRRMQRLAGELRAGEVGQLRVGFTPTAPSELLAELVRRFRKRCPNVNVELVEMSSQEQQLALSNGSLDVALVRRGAALGSRSRVRETDSGSTFLPLIEERLVVTLPRDSAWAKVRTIELSVLRDERWVLVRREASPTVYDAIVAGCLRVGFSPTVVQLGSQLHSVLAMVASGLGVSLLPESASRWRTKGVVFVPAKEVVTSRVGLSIPAHGAIPASVWFAEIAEEWSDASRAR